MTIDPVRRDVWIWGISVIVCGLLGQVLAPHFLPATLQQPFALACALGASVTLKFLMPRHAILKLIPWLYFLLVMPIMVGAAVLLFDWSLLGFFTLPAIAGLLILLGLVHFLVGPKQVDGPT